MKYRIHANRTPHLMKMPGDTFLDAPWSFLVKKVCKFYSTLGQNLSKMTIVRNQKLLNSNRTPALYLRGYGSSIRLLNGALEKM